MSAIRTAVLSVTAVAAMAVVGCQSVQEGNERAQMAAYAARQDVPATMPAEMSAMSGTSSNTVNIGATLSGKSSLLLQNYTNTSYANFDVWVNGAFVRHVEALGARSSLTLDLTQFYDKAGQTLVQSGAPVTSVLIKTKDMTANLLGPVSNG